MTAATYFETLGLIYALYYLCILSYDAYKNARRPKQEFQGIYLEVPYQPPPRPANKFCCPLPISMNKGTAGIHLFEFADHSMLGHIQSS